MGTGTFLGTAVQSWSRRGIRSIRKGKPAFLCTYHLLLELWNMLYSGSRESLGYVFRMVFSLCTCKILLVNLYDLFVPRQLPPRRTSPVPGIPQLQVESKRYHET